MKSTPSEGPLTAAILAYVASRAEQGASRPEIQAACNVKPRNLNLRISRRLIPAGLLIQAGPQKHYRFFTDQAHADAYAQSIPQVIADMKAAAKARQKLRQADYVKRATAAKVTRVVAAVVGAGQAGMSRKEVDEALQVVKGKNTSDALSNACRQRLIYPGGPLQFRRYFANDEWAADWDISGKEARDAKVKESARERNRRNAHAKRQRDAAYREAKRKERAKDVSRRANALVVTPGRSAPVNVKAPTRADLATAAMVIPPGVEVQRCKPWTHDVRYSVEPGRRVIGEFTTEWRQRRAA